MIFKVPSSANHSTTLRFCDRAAQRLESSTPAGGAAGRIGRKCPPAPRSPGLPACPVTPSLPSHRRRCERVMAASKPVEAPGGGGSGTGLSRWQLALVLGAPILLGAGAVYLWGRRAARRGGKGASERKTPEGRASPGPYSGGAQPDGPGHEEMVSACSGPWRGPSPAAAVGGGGRGQASRLTAGPALA